MRRAECGISRTSSQGWRALTGEEDDGELMVAVFCPEWAAREFD